MNGATRLFRFVVFSNIYIACCAVLMAWQTMWLFAIEPHVNLLLFIFFATMSSYSFHWMLSTEYSSRSARAQWMNRYHLVHPAFFVVGLIGTAYEGWLLIDHWQWLSLVAFVTFLYSAPKVPYPLFHALRKIAVGKTLFLSIVWTVVTALLPVVVSGTDWQIWHTTFLVNRFFLIYAICILFDLRDRDLDRRMGIRSLITWLNAGQVRLLFMLSVVLFIMTSLVMLAFGQPVVKVVVLVVPGIITALLYKKAITDFSDRLYYLVLDGLMAASALIFLLFHLTSAAGF